MKIQDCNLDPTHIVASPFIRSKPAEYWTRARKEKIIPESLFMLYHNADYFSLDRAPKYLADPERKLFSYMGILLNAMCSCFAETKEMLPEIRSLEEKEYNPLKRITGETWDENASKLQGRLFKLFIIELVSALDLYAELVSLLLPGVITGLKLGSSMYSRLEYWLNSPFEITDRIVSPIHYYLENLHSVLNAKKVKGESEQDWYQLLQLYRNKLAHLGTPVIRKLIFHDKKGEFYKFLPNSWPFLWEKDLRLPGEETEGDEKPGPEFFETILMHDDFITFCESSRKKIFEYIDVGCIVLNKAYIHLKDSEMNKISLEELISNEKHYGFKSFV